MPNAAGRGPIARPSSSVADSSRVARQEGLEPPTHSLEGCRSIQLSYWRNGRTDAPPAERR
jgi:hypothetical protein